MSDAEEDHVEERGPTELRDPFVRRELTKAAIWFGLGLFILAVVVLAQPLLLIAAGVVFAAILDGGTRLLGRILPIGRGWRLAIITLLGLAFIAGVIVYSGMELVAQAEALQRIVTTQVNRALAWANELGLTGGGFEVQQLSQQLMGTLGRLTSAVGSAVGGITSMLMVLVIGIFIAADPRLYERGIAWMLPMRTRDGFYRITERMGRTLRRLMFGRLLGMLVEGVGTWFFLMIGGVPMATLLGILTGLLAFIPNIGAIISGVLMVLVGFSHSVETGLWALGVYVAVQAIDGYLIVPYVAKRTVDLAPALVLGAQLLFGALFGLLGLMLADPIIAMIKAALEQKSLEDEERAPAAPA
jgi:predicted PurR-regulated permease PerM